MKEKIAAAWDRVREQRPLVHHLTNYVTVNDVANITLAAGASPVMADCAEEVAEITRLSQGLCLNIGTINERVQSSMLLAAQEAATLGHSILLDPVGAGASALRTKAAREIMAMGKVTALRGNVSEIKSLLKEDSHVQGVDAGDCLPESTEEAAHWAMTASRSLQSVIAVTGKVDLVADAEKCFAIYNGRPEMSRITGTGCQCSALAAAALAAGSEPLIAAAAAVMAMGLAGEIAYSRLQAGEGNSTYRNRIIDAIYHLSGQELAEGARYEIYG